MAHRIFLLASANLNQNLWPLDCYQNDLGSNALADALGSAVTAHGVKSDPLGYGLQNTLRSNVFLVDMLRHQRHHHNLQCCT